MSFPPRFRHHALLICLVGVLAAIPSRSPAQLQNSSSADASSPSTIAGVVINASTGLPVSRALVRFGDRAMLTGHDGKFEFAEVTSTTGNLQAIKPGFYSSIDAGDPTSLSLRPGRSTVPLILRLYPEAIFSGSVAAPDGDPLPHVVVVARRNVFYGSSREWIPAAQVQTDEHGRFRLPVPAGDYRLESMYMPRANGMNEVLLPTQLPAETSSNTSGYLHIRSGEEQHFNLHPVASRAYTVTATFDSSLGRGFPRITASLANGGTITLPVRFSGAGRTGNARIELPSGTYTLTASVMSPEGAEQGETSVTVTDHDVSGVVFHLSPVAALPVDCFVEDASTSENTQPKIQQLGLMLENDRPNSEVFNSTIRLTLRRDGTLVFIAPPGTYRLRANGNSSWYVKSASYGTSDLLQKELIVGLGAESIPIRIGVSNQTASLQGVCRAGGLPGDCWIYLIPTTPSAYPVFILHANSEQGIYSYSNLPPGSYQVVAFEQRHSADYRDPATIAPFATYLRTITLASGEKPTLDLDVVPEAEIAP